jgi:hypothetical protein
MCSCGNDAETFRPPYPFPVEPDGCSICANCAGEGSTGSTYPFPTCSTCDGAGFLTKEQIDAWIARRQDDEGYQQLQRRIASYKPVPYDPETDPF